MILREYHLTAESKYGARLSGLLFPTLCDGDSIPMISSSRRLDAKFVCQLPEALNIVERLLETNFLRVEVDVYDLHRLEGQMVFSADPLHGGWCGIIKGDLTAMGMNSDPFAGMAPKNHICPACQGDEEIDCKLCNNERYVTEEVLDEIYTEIKGNDEAVNEPILIVVHDESGRPAFIV
jgi:hypothetical protein